MEQLLTKSRHPKIELPNLEPRQKLEKSKNNSSKQPWHLAVMMIQTSPMTTKVLLVQTKVTETSFKRRKKLKKRMVKSKEKKVTTNQRKGKHCPNLVRKP